MEPTLSEPQPQTGAWLTDDGTLLLRRYGTDVFTVTRNEGDRWGIEYLLVAESWDFGVAS